MNPNLHYPGPNKEQEFKCNDCEHLFSENRFLFGKIFGLSFFSGKIKCPECKSTNIIDLRKKPDVIVVN